MAPSKQSSSSSLSSASKVPFSGILILFVLLLFVSVMCQLSMTISLSSQQHVAENIVTADIGNDRNHFISRRVKQQQLRQKQEAQEHDGVQSSEGLKELRVTKKRKHEVSSNEVESLKELRERLPPSIWSLAGSNSDPSITEKVRKLLTEDEIKKSKQICSKVLFSTLRKAVTVQGDMAYVATGDIDSMWTRDSAVQMGLYNGRIHGTKNKHIDRMYLRRILEGAIKRQAFNIVQDPYANAYSKHWKSPKSWSFKDRVIGRGGWVDTRNYELDSGAYFLTQLYDYYVIVDDDEMNDNNGGDDEYRRSSRLFYNDNNIILDAITVLIDTWIIEQNHDELSKYRYFELPNQGKGAPTYYTGMTWTGFRPSDDAVKFNYLIPANIHAAAGLERIIAMNQRIWKSNSLDKKATKLLQDITDGINKYGIVKAPTGLFDGTTTMVYAYEVDGRSGVNVDMDDANIPSLLSIPLLGWTGYNREVYKNTRRRLLDPAINKFYYKGSKLEGIGSPHTPRNYIWSMALSIEALTLTDESLNVSLEEQIDTIVKQMRQSLLMACNGVMHESVSVNSGCPQFTRSWFEWSNALFVVLVETALGIRCDADDLNSDGNNAERYDLNFNKDANNKYGHQFHSDPYRNDPSIQDFYQSIEAAIPFSP